MKFRTRMILAYMTISLLVSLVLGLIVYRTSLGYETRSRKNNLSVSAKSYITQMDDRLGRMDAIMYYILSDPAMLDSITLLGRASAEDLPQLFVREAQTTLDRGISTEYIMRNSYRTVFFNEYGFFSSSALKMSGQTSINQRLIESFDLSDIDYLEPVLVGDGHSVIVGPHRDFWAAYGDTGVFSLMKAPRGYCRQFLEVEMRVDSLELLESPDPGTCFAVIVNGDELLYVGGNAATEDSSPAAREAEANRFLKIVKSLAAGETLTEDGSVFAKAESDSYAVSVLAFKSTEAMAEGRNRIFLTSFLTALVAFAVSLVSIIIWSSVLVKPVKYLQRIVEETSIDNLRDTARTLQMDAAPELDEFTNLARSYQAMTKRLDIALQNEKRSAMLQLQAQFDTLQTQVNPHFIYNVLNIISSRAVIADDEVICEMCGCLGNMLRYSTNNKARYARISEELEYLNNYFYLLKSRYQNRLQVKIDVENEIMDVVIPKMTLQQIVENSVKHGYHETDESMEISILGKKNGEGWNVLVSDNGSGAEEENLRKIREKLQEIRESYEEKSVPTEAEIGGIGLTNTYARCLLLFGQDLIFELGNRTDQPGFFVRLGLDNSHNK